MILAPFWGTNPEPVEDPNNGRFDRYAENGSSFLRLSPLADCDVGVFPQNWESAGDRAVELAQRFGELCRNAGKPAVVFHGLDSTDPLPVDAVTFRMSLLRSSRRANEFAQPAWSEDFLERYLGGEVRARKKRPRPIVAFCGNPATTGKPISIRGRVRQFMQSPLPGRRRLAGDHPRAIALRAVERDRRLETNFVLRETFWAGAPQNPTSLLRTREQYVRNMLESDYVLCVRGIGNFSYRLYETLSMGRIPVFVDTDCVLPFDFEIDWRAHCVWVDSSEIDRIGDRVLEFHESLDEAEFEERQRACRELWETRISPQGFFASFHRHFEAA